ncbi:MAG TPA: DUF5916 domain-containing protein, partial [Longimicrobiaceae bacterium]
AVRTTQAARLTGTIHPDGRLDEPAWASAPATGDFTQSWPKPGSPATQRTEVRVLYDDDALYVGVRAFDSHPDSIASQLARRDATGIYSDWVHVVVDSYHDRRSGFRFAVNPRGVKKDVLHSNDTNEDLNWDAVWEVGTAVDSAGWTAEYRIPFSQIRFGPVPRGTPRTWGLQVQREIARYQERDSWSPWTQQSGGFISSEGDLTGILDVPMPHRLEVMPYASTRVTRDPGVGRAVDPFYTENDVAIGMGADVKAGLPGGLTLTGTINPDFGQVEVDPAVVNLSAFETFFPEKRPFFVEGADVFNFGQVRVGPSYGFQQFFYSRRIGAPPHGFVRDADFVDAPDQTTILGAAKISGKTGPWSVGVLEALTAEERARYATSDGTRGRAVVEPWTNFLVGRVRRDLNAGNTVVGAMVTSTNRALDDSVLAGVLRSRANLAGVDFQHQWADHQWTVSGYVAGSSIAGTTDVIGLAQQSSARYYQRPDAGYLELDPTRTSLTGYMAELALLKSGAWNLSLDLRSVSPGFEINDMGFQGRTDYRSATASVGYNENRAGKTFRSWNLFLGENNAWNYGGDYIWSSVFWNGGMTLNNFWSAGFYGEFDPGTATDRLTRGGPLARTPTSWSVGTWGNTDTRKAIFSDWSFSVGGDRAGGNNWSAYAGLTYRPTPSVRISFGPSVSHTLETRQFVRSVGDDAFTETYGRRYVFADLRQTVVAADTRVDWTFTRDLTLQLYAQPFVAAGSFARFKQLSQAGTGNFGVFGQDVGTICFDATERTYTADPVGNCAAPATTSASAFPIFDPDFNFRSLRGNAVLRWEYRPGSTLYFVWQQERSGAEPFGDFRFRRDAGAIFDQPARNVFVIKASYWLSR